MKGNDDDAGDIAALEKTVDDLYELIASVHSDNAASKDRSSRLSFRECY